MIPSHMNLSGLPNQHQRPCSMSPALEEGRESCLGLLGGGPSLWNSLPQGRVFSPLSLAGLSLLAKNKTKKQSSVWAFDDGMSLRAQASASVYSDASPIMVNGAYSQVGEARIAAQNTQAALGKCLFGDGNMNKQVQQRFGRKGF